MSKNADWAYNWGAGAEGTDSGVWIAPPGTTLPTDLDAWGAGFGELGWLADGGITEGHSMDSTPTNAWQGGVLIKTVKSNEARTFQFQCLEENALVMGLLRPGSVASSAAGITTTHVKSGTGSDIRVSGYDLLVGSVHKRIIAPTSEVTTFGDIVYQSTAITVYEFTMTCYPDPEHDNDLYIEISNAPGVVVADSSSS
jgi:hypothetical protein